MARLQGKIDWQPDAIAAVARGGVVPAVLLANRFGVKDVYALMVKKMGGKRQVVTKVIEDMTGKKVLLFEDRVESGKSMAAARKYLEGRGAAVRPDYVVDVSDDVMFPWEVRV